LLLGILGGSFLASEIQLRAMEVQQKDAGKGKVCIDDEAMRAIGVVAGDIVELQGQRRTTAIARSAPIQDRGKAIIRLDGLIRKNAGATLNQMITVREAEAKDAENVLLAPVDMRLNVDADFVEFVKTRLHDTPLLEGDSLFLQILGSAIPFQVLSTSPKGILLARAATKVEIMSAPLELSSGERGPNLKRLHRRAWVMRMMEEMRAEKVRFVIPDHGTWDDEEQAFVEALRMEEESGKPVEVFLELVAESGPVRLRERLQYAEVYSREFVSYVYDEGLLDSRYTRFLSEELWPRERAKRFGPP